MTIPEYVEEHGPHPDDGPICVTPKAAIDCKAMAEYILAYPEKAAALLADRIADDDMAAFREDLYEHICVADWNGPAFEKWRAS